MTISAETTTDGAACPQCQAVSTHIHSHYRRCPQDLPSSGRAIRLALAVRRFRCRNAACSQKIFCERLPGVVSVSAQRTLRLTTSLSELALASGGEAGSRQSKRQGMSASPSTLLRLIRRHCLPAPPTARVLGVDDFALRRGQVYGTLLVDHDSHRPVDVVPERTAKCLAAWLKAHPGVQVITRDRSGEYARGAKEGAPQAVQVADRWHVLHNLWEAAATSYEPYRTLLGQVRLESITLPAKQTPVPLTVDSVPPPLPKLSPQAQARQMRWEGWQAKFAQVHVLHEQGLSHQAIARQTQLSYAAVRKYLRMSVYPKRTVSRAGARLLDPYKAYLREQVALGHTAVDELHRDLQARGFKGGRSTVYLGLVQYRQELGLPAQRVPASVRETIQRRVSPLTPRALTALVLKKPDKRSTQQEAAIAQANLLHPTIAQISAWTAAFATCLRQRDVPGLSAWITEVNASASPALKAFATGLLNDWDAVQAAFTLPFSNGLTEGHVNRLKTIKRTMYGRASFDLLRLRVLSAA